MINDAHISVNRFKNNIFLLECNTNEKNTMMLTSKIYTKHETI